VKFVEINDIFSYFGCTVAKSIGCRFAINTFQTTTILIGVGACRLISTQTIAMIPTEIFEITLLHKHHINLVQRLFEFL